MDTLVTGSESPASERPLSDGAEFSGDYNFRTGKMDCGTDPSGWYEDDLWGANSYSSHKFERFPSLVIFHALLRWCQTKANGSPKTAGRLTT